MAIGYIAQPGTCLDCFFRQTKVDGFRNKIRGRQCATTAVPCGRRRLSPGRGTRTKDVEHRFRSVMWCAQTNDRESTRALKFRGHTNASKKIDRRHSRYISPTTTNPSTRRRIIPLCVLTHKLNHQNGSRCCMYLTPLCCWPSPSAKSPPSWAIMA